MPITKEHELKETLTVDVITPAHEARTTTRLFELSKKQLMKREDPPRCWICRRTADEVGPLEAHHAGIERSFAEGEIDWEIVKQDFPHYDWTHFDPANPYAFVDDMEAQGILLCKTHHTGKGTGIHTIPEPLWRLQRYLKDGVQFTPTETIHHDHV
jgi:hypothetical protein